MRLVFALSGEGFGHAARAYALAERLSVHHDIQFWCPETVQRFLREPFPDLPMRTIPILELIKKDHQIKIFQTGIKNIPLLYFSFDKVAELADELKSEKIDAVISDYEPMSARAARKAKIPLLAVNHQGVLYDKWCEGFDHFFARIANWSMMPHYDKLLVSSFYNGDVGPIIRKDVEAQIPTQGDYIFVYLKESFKSQLIPLLDEFPNEIFKFFPDPNHDFVEALAGAKAVIAPAGHQLICECLMLKKPALVFPESMQYEQRLNANMLERSGWGMNACKGDLRKNLSSFLSNLDEYPKEADPNVSYIFQNDVENAVAKIEAYLATLPVAQ